jgi:hypothetical protein
LELCEKRSVTPCEAIHAWIATQLSDCDASGLNATVPNVEEVADKKLWIKLTRSEHAAVRQRATDAGVGD